MVTRAPRWASIAPMHSETPQSDPAGTWFADGPAAQSSETSPQTSPAQSRAALAAVAVLFAGGLWALQPFLPALGWGVIFAVSLWPWHARLAQRCPRHGRLAIPGLMTCLVLLAFVLPLLMVISAIADESAGVAHWLATASAQGAPVPAFFAHLPYGDHFAAWWQANLAAPGAITHLSHDPQGASRLHLATGEHILGGLLHRVLLIGFMLLVLFFLLRDGDRVALALRIGSCRAFGPAGERVGNQIVTAIRGTVNGLVIVGFGEGVIMGVAYEIAGVPHAALLGLFTGLLSAVPLGSVIAVVVAAGALVAGGAIGPAVAVAALGAVVVFVADHFVRPALIGDATRLPFLWVLLGILGGIEAWGLIGLVLGPALMAALMLLWREWVGAQPGALNPVRAVVTGD